MSAFDLSRPVRGTGPQPAKIAIVGEGPGKNEHAQGRPFVGATGEEMNVYLREGGISRSRCRILNCLLYWTGPGDPDPEPSDLARDFEDLAYDLFQTQPELIVAVGGFALRTFLPGLSLDAAHGVPHRVDIGTLLGWGRPYEAIVVPAFHPAAGFHDSAMAHKSAEDFKVAGKVAAGEVRFVEDEYPQTYYEVIERGVLWDKTDLIGVDTEGWEDRPYCLTYSFKPGSGFMIRADDKANIDDFKRVLARDRPAVSMHYSQHDLPVLKAMGVDLIAMGIPIHDTMVMAYEFGDSQGLKALCYRHFGMVMEDYDDLTASFDALQAFRYLTEASRLCLNLPKPDPILEWDTKTGEQRVRKPNHIKNRIATAIGKDDPRKSWLGIEPEIRTPLESLVGEMPLFSLDLVKPFARVVKYACRDADGHRRLALHFLSQMDERLRRLYDEDMKIIPMMVRMREYGIGIDKSAFARLSTRVELEMAKLQRRINAHNGGTYLNPASADQVRALIYDKFGLTTKILTKKGRKLSTNDKALEALKGKHPAVVDITDWRERAKVKGSFSDVLPHTADADNRIHASIKSTRTVTGRRAYSDPNLQAIPIRSDLGREVRACFVAPPGRFLASADLSQIEMRIIAHLSRDEAMIKLIASGADFHTVTACDIFGVTEAEVKDHPQLYREPAKRTGFGIATGITGIGLNVQLEMNGIFAYDADASQEIIDAWFRKYKGVAAFIDYCRSKARRDGYIDTMGGRRRYLPGTRSHIPWVRSQAERDSHSHKIQGSAAEILKDAEGLIWDQLQLPRWKKVEPLLTIHDEIVMEGEKGQEKDLGVMMVAAMTSRKDLRVPLEAKYSFGQSWRDCK